MSLYAKYNTLGKEEKTNEKFKVESIKTMERRNQIISTHTIVVIEYYTTWCGSCYQISSKYTELAKKYNKKNICILVKENSEENLGNLPIPIWGVPCFHFYQNGNFLEEFTILGASLSKVEENLKKIF